MSTEQHPGFTIQPNILHGLRIFLHSQLFVTPPIPETPFTGQTVIITGSSSGLGLEAARHFYRLGAAKLILAARNPVKGEAAKADIVNSIHTRDNADANAIEVWPLDQTSTQSTLAFAERVKAELPRVDVVMLNAGVINDTFRLCEEGYEEVTQVNVLNTFLLALALLPEMREAKEKFQGSTPHLTVVSSEAHRLTRFEEINAPDLYERLNDEGCYSTQGRGVYPLPSPPFTLLTMNGCRYQVTKLLEVLLTRELVARLDAAGAVPRSTPPVIINMVNPGLCKSNLGVNKDNSQSLPLLARLGRRLLDRTTEVGSRTLVLAASAPTSSHGEFQSDGKQQDVEAWIYSDVGRRVQEKVWEQTVRILETRKPGILKEAGL
jgi:NAD(P)-dependent dehydrogenase (short-subunit alcohol dehydrogenase family)